MTEPTAERRRRWTQQGEAAEPSPRGRLRLAARRLPHERREEPAARRPRASSASPPCSWPSPAGSCMLGGAAERAGRPAPRDLHRDLGRAARHRRPQRRGAGHRHQDGLGLRRAAQDHRQGRGDRAAHGRPAGPRRQGSARQARHQEGLRLGQARDHAAPAGRGLSARPARRRLPAREQARLSQRRRPPPMCSASPISTMSASPASRSTSTSQGLQDLQRRRARDAGPDLKPVQLSIDLRVQHVLRDELVKGMEQFKATRRPARSST